MDDTRSELVDQARELLDGNYVRAKELQDALINLVQMQAIVSSIVEPLEPSKDQVTTVGFALIDEVGELAKEMGWKPWKARPEMSVDQEMRILDEWADVTAFYLAMTAQVLQLTKTHSSDLVYAYLLKTNKNIMRFIGESGEDGYIGMEELNG